MKTKLDMLLMKGKKSLSFTKTFDFPMTKEEARKIRNKWLNRPEATDFDLVYFQVATIEA